MRFQYGTDAKVTEGFYAGLIGTVVAMRNTSRTNCQGEREVEYAVWLPHGERSAWIREQLLVEPTAKDYEAEFEGPIGIAGYGRSSGSLHGPSGQPQTICKRCNGVGCEQCI